MELTMRQAERLLTGYAEVVSSRDQVILAALDAGLSKRRIWLLTGIARSTIAEIQRAHHAEPNPLLEETLDALMAKLAGT